jgi:glycosyltransferase involved in cell wall biosynthesis
LRRKLPRRARGHRFVTCLCLTRDRRTWLPKAIACFQQQTYRRAELLILADGEDVRDLVPANDERIRLIHLAESRTIGEKRNFGCARAGGEVICHWDDDDYSAPGRLERQIALLLESGRSMVGFSHMRFTDGASWWQYEGTKNYALGTSLCYWREWQQKNPFPPANIGEDNQMVSRAQAAGQIVSEDAGELMYATIHSGNTSPRSGGNNWKKL